MAKKAKGLSRRTKRLVYREAATSKGIGRPMKLAWRQLKGRKKNFSAALNLAFIAGKKAGYQEGRTGSRMYRRKRR